MNETLSTWREKRPGACHRGDGFYVFQAIYGLFTTLIQHKKCKQCQIFLISQTSLWGYFSVMLHSVQPV